MPLVDAAKDVVGDTATGVMDYGVSSGARDWCVRGVCVCGCVVSVVSVV
jgi:hypothetical protein